MSAEYGLCLTCYEVIDPLVYARGDYNICPKMNCNHELIFIDELMIPIIITLNKKGYETQQCCSSHLWDADLYIDFQPGIIVPKTLPHGLFLHTKVIQEDFAGIDGPDMADQKIQNTIRTDWECYEKWSTLSMIEKQKIIFNHLTILLEWADKLPDKNSPVYLLSLDEKERWNSTVAEIALKEDYARRSGYFQSSRSDQKHIWFQRQSDTILSNIRSDLDNKYRCGDVNFIDTKWSIPEICEAIIQHKKEERV